MSKERRGGFIAAIAFLLSSLAIVWGIVAVCPGCLFSTSPAYRMFIGREEFYGWGAIIAGVLQSWGAYKGRAAWLITGALLLLTFWGIGAAFFLQANLQSAAGYLYLVYVAWQTYVVIAAIIATGRR